LCDTFEGLKNDIGIQNREPLASMECKGWRDEILLKAADLITYEKFKVIERKFVGAEMRIPMKRILLSSRFAGRNAMLTKAGLREFTKTTPTNPHSISCSRDDLVEMLKRNVHCTGVRKCRKDFGPAVGAVSDYRHFSGAEVGPA
jgi:hypothetical protein